MKKTRFYGLCIIIAVVLGIVFTGCGQPNGMGAEADANRVETENSMRNYLALLKAQDSHKVSIEGLQQIVSGLTSEFITNMPDSRTVSAGNSGNNVTGIRKLEVNNRNSFQNRNRAGGGRGLFTEPETEPEPVEIYEFAFGNPEDGSEQYVLASTDSRIGHFLALTNGSLVDAKGEFAEYFKIALEEYTDSVILEYNDITEAEVEAALAEIEAETETVQSRISGPYDGTSNWTHYATTTNVAIQKSPLLLTNWGQGAPYNGYIEQRYGTGVLAGCGAVAIAQIVAYHNYTNPNTASKNRMAPNFNNTAGYWTNSGNGQYNLSLIRTMSSITSSSSSAARGQAAALMYHVMREGLEGYYAQQDIKNGGIYYIPFNVTYSNTGDYAQTFKNLGYSVSFADNATSVSGSTNGSWSITYRNNSLTNVKNALNNNRPVLIRGATINIQTNKETSGHVWVIDGYGTVTSIIEWYYKNSDRSQIVSRQNTVNNVILVHCNLGWDGANQGYAVENGNPTAYQGNDKNPNKGWFIYGIFDAGNLTPQNKDIREGDGNFSTNTYIVIPVK